MVPAGVALIQIGQQPVETLVLGQRRALNRFWLMGWAMFLQGRRPGAVHRYSRRSADDLRASGGRGCRVRSPSTWAS